MIIVADSGATKADWRIITDVGDVIPFETKGMNPYFCNHGDFHAALAKSFPVQIKHHEVTHVFFYGAGCGGEEKGELVARAISNFFTESRVVVNSDVLGAARSLFSMNHGLVIILGTGANIAYYNGSTTINRTPSLGFILGDEGSGASLGKELIRRYLYGTLGEEISERLRSTHDIKLTSVLDDVYKNPKPSSYLASFVPFIDENRLNPDISEIVSTEFEKLYNVHLRVYDDLQSLRIGVVGSVGYLFRDFLNALAKEKGFKLDKILQYPIDSLVEFHKLNPHSSIPRNP